MINATICRLGLCVALLLTLPAIAQSITTPPPAIVGLTGWWPDDADDRVTLTRLDLPGVSLTTWVEQPSDTPPIERMQNAIRHTADRYDCPELLDAKPEGADAMFMVADRPKDAAVRLYGLFHPSGRMRCVAVVDTGGTFAKAPQLEQRVIGLAFMYLVLWQDVEPGGSPARPPIGQLARRMPESHRPDKVLHYGPPASDKPSWGDVFRSMISKPVPVFTQADRAITQGGSYDLALFGPQHGELLEAQQTTLEPIDGLDERLEKLEHAPPDYRPFERGAALRFGPIADNGGTPDPNTLGVRQAVFTPDGRFAMGMLEHPNLSDRLTAAGEIPGLQGEYFVDGHVMTLRVDGNELTPDGHVIHLITAWRPADGQTEFGDKARILIGKRVYTADATYRPAKPELDRKSE